MPMITVIVPVFNARDYLEKCVNSILTQTEEDWELLLVNDGSTDGSEELCHSLSRSDPRIRVLDRPNGGVGSARNAGLDAAAGDYISFLDSDDTFSPDHLCILRSALEGSGAGAAAVGAVTVAEDGREIARTILEPGVFRGASEILTQAFPRGKNLYACWNKLFQKDLIGDIRFSTYTRAEDALFCARVLSRAETYAVSGEASYRYLRRADSVTMRSPVRGLADQLLAWKEIYEILRQISPELGAFAAQKICHDADTLCRPMLGAGKEDRRLVKAMRARFFPLQFAPEGPSLRKKAASALYQVSPELFYRLAGR